MNQKYGRQGQADFVLYPMAAQFPTAFHDVVVGTNSVPCAYSATTSADTPNCIAVVGALTDSDGTLEGQIGNTTTKVPEYNAAVGYDLASGLGTVDASVLVNNWSKVSFKATTTTLTPSSTSFTHGTSITVSGTVSPGSPAGNVALLTSSTEQNQQGQMLFPLNAGAFSGSTSTLPGGTYNIWGQYGGDGTNALSNSTPVSITVSPENSAIALNLISQTSVFNASTPPGSSVDYGTQLNLSALVVPSAQLTVEEACVIGNIACPVHTQPTGTVTFSDGSAVLNSALINEEGDAEYNAPFTVGSHSVTASYAGDQSYKASTAAAIPFTVVKDTPVIGIGASNFYQGNQFVGGQNQPTVINVEVENQAVYNASLSGFAPVAVAAPTGTITVSGLPSGVPSTATLTPGFDPNTGAAQGVATFTIPANTTGTYNIGVSYPGDANYNVSTMPASQIVVFAPTGQLVSTTTATATGSISPTTTMTISGTVTGQSGHVAPTGYVVLFSSGNQLNSYASLTAPASGVASTYAITLNSSALAPGANFITVQYFGDTNYYPSAVALSTPNPVSNPDSDFSMIPATTIVPVTAGASAGATDTISLASALNFAGNVTLTCTAAPGVTCSIPSSATLSAGGSASTTLTLSAGQYAANIPYNVLVTGSDPTGKYVHTLGVVAQVTGGSAGSSSFALSNSSNGTLTFNQGATTGNTSTITVTPLGSFTGTVALACAMTPPSGATTLATCSMSPTSVALSGTTAQTAMLTINTTASTSGGAYTVTVTGTSGSLVPTTTLAVNIGTPGFGVASSGAITVAPGATTGNTSTITVTPNNGFTGTVNLSCAFTTNASNDPATCSIPATVTVSGTTAQTATLTINTTAATTSMNQTRKLFWPSAGGASLALLLFFCVPRRRRNWLAMLGLLAVFASMAAMGCGGGGSGGGGGGGGGGNSGTSAGTYSVTVTAASGSVTQTTTVSVTVN